MFWAIVIGGFLLYLFISTKKEEVQKVQNQGGVLVKYQTLTNHFLSIPMMKVEQRSSTSITMAVKEPKVVTRFIISHGFENVSVFWFHKSLSFGEHSLNWRFPEGMEQLAMIKEIDEELYRYQINLMNGF
ncbi:MAG TPA: hypothetical protein DER05_02125 [Lutibacter sp.]|nr:hypothetical protein [Lutibacter sp.]